MYRCMKCDAPAQMPCGCSEKNQCDGCMCGAELRDNNLHYDRHGVPFMFCQRGKYLINIASGEDVGFM